MRIAVVSDIHGNSTAFKAVLADLKDAAPDLIFHGGDLADSGSSPTEIIDQVRDLGWLGVLGNTDEMLFRPEALTSFASASPRLRPMFDKIGEMAAWTRDRLGDDRIVWLSNLPGEHVIDTMALVHASPGDPWRSPSLEAEEGALGAAYTQLNRSLVVYGHIHQPYVREVGGITIANSGGVGLPYDGDRRASYLLIDKGRAMIRRVDYDTEKELALLLTSSLPHAEWIARTLRSARPELP